MHNLQPYKVVESYMVFRKPLMCDRLGRLSVETKFKVSLHRKLVSVLVHVNLQFIYSRVKTKDNIESSSVSDLLLLFSDV